MISQDLDEVWERVLDTYDDGVVLNVFCVVHREFLYVDKDDGHGE